MYKKVDGVLNENSSDNYFYDDEFIYVQELLNEFTETDWKDLAQNLKNRDDKYKIRLAYCINEDNGVDGFNLLLGLLGESDEVFEYTIDSLRSFRNIEYKKILKFDKDVLEKVERLIQKASLPIKQMLENFLEQLEFY